jgi:hypothetical protein
MDLGDDEPLAAPPFRLGFYNRRIHPVSDLGCQEISIPGVLRGRSSVLHRRKGKAAVYYAAALRNRHTASAKKPAA